MTLQTRVAKLEQALIHPVQHHRVFAVGGSSDHTDDDLTAFMAAHGIERQETDQVIFLTGFEPAGWAVEHVPLDWVGRAPDEARSA